jgi:transposase-like protein
MAMMGGFLLSRNSLRPRLVSAACESLWSLVRQRTDQIDVFTTETSCLTIVWATIQDIRLHKLSL